MTTQVAFLRAVNLGKRTAKSTQLVGAVEGLGYTGAWTYINSGNVVFDGSGSRNELEDQLEAAFEKALGFEATTFVRSAAELRRIVRTTPFKAAAGDTHFVTFLKQSLTGTKKKALEALSNDFDTLVVKGRDVHWLMHGRSSDSPLKAKQWDDIVGRHCSTSRNMNGLTKLVAKIDG